MYYGISTVIVSTHSRLKAAGWAGAFKEVSGKVSTHSRLKAAGFVQPSIGANKPVSTHSRLKAAGYADITPYTSLTFQHTAA